MFLLVTLSVQFSVPIALTKDNIYGYMVDLAAKLKSADAVGSETKTPFVVVNPVIEALLLKSPEFIHATNMGDEVLRKVLSVELQD